MNNNNDMIKNILFFYRKVFGTVDRVQFLISIIMGLLLNLAYPPYSKLLVLPLVFSSIYLLIINSKSIKNALVNSYVFSYTFLICNVIWVSNALKIDEGLTWLAPLVVLAMPAYMALFPTISLCILYMNRNLSNLLRLSLFAMSWVLFEYFRGVGSYGFSMNYIGYTLAASESIAQLASIFSSYGLSFFAILIATTPSEIYLLFKTNIRKSVLFALCSCFGLCVAILWGDYRLYSAPMDLDYEVRIRIVQGGMTPYQLWRTQYMQNALVRHYLDLSLREGYENITHFIWGESTLPLAVDVSASNFWPLVKNLPPKSFLLTGSARLSGSDMEEFSSKDSDLFNSWLAIENGTGIIKAYYDKSQLVPFGEFLPFRRILTNVFAQGTLNGIRDFTKGKSKTSIISIENTPDFHVMICYETMFMGRVLSALHDTGNKTPKWILNVTNDGWFGQSSGAYQHLAVSKIRAIESGLPFIRSANTGISAVFDSYGRLVDSLPLGASSTMDVYLPKNAHDTFIVKIYRYIQNAWILASAIIIFSLLYNKLIISLISLNRRN